MTRIPPQAITAASQAVHALPYVAEVRRYEPDACRKIAQAALAAALPFLAEDGWDAARDRATETNQARRGERERCAQLAVTAGAMYPDARVGTSWQPFADLLREAQP